MAEEQIFFMRFQAKDVLALITNSDEILARPSADMVDRFQHETVLDGERST